jgi:hypothetical protein
VFIVHWHEQNLEGVPFNIHIQFSRRDNAGLKQQPPPYWCLIKEAKTVIANVYLPCVLKFVFTLPSYQTSVCVYVKWPILQLFITLKTSSIKLNSGIKIFSKTRVWVFHGKCYAWSTAAELIKGWNAAVTVYPKRRMLNSEHCCRNEEVKINYQFVLLQLWKSKKALGHGSGDVGDHVIRSNIPFTFLCWRNLSRIGKTKLQFVCKMWTPHRNSNNVIRVFNYREEGLMASFLVRLCRRCCTWVQAILPRATSDDCS